MTGAITESHYVEKSSPIFNNQGEKTNWEEKTAETATIVQTAKETEKEQV